MPFTVLEALNNNLQEIEDLGVIEKTASLYCSLMVGVKKKDGSVQICLDARALNDRMLADTECQPNPEELLQKFDNCRVLSTIDLPAPYWQIS